MFSGMSGSDAGANRWGKVCFSLEEIDFLFMFMSVKFPMSTVLQKRKNQCMGWE